MSITTAQWHKRKEKLWNMVERELADLGTADQFSLVFSLTRHFLCRNACMSCREQTLRNAMEVIRDDFRQYPADSDCGRGASNNEIRSEARH